MASPLADRPPLVEVVPPRDLEGGMRAARGMLGALAGEPVVLEVLVTADGPRWLLRAATADVLAHLTVQVRAAHPRAVVSAVERDPLALAPGEHAAVVTMQPASAAALPLRAEWRLERDPLLGVVAAVSPVSEDRVLLQLALGPVRRKMVARKSG